MTVPWILMRYRSTTTRASYSQAALLDSVVNTNSSKHRVRALK
jgi:hypothetical protein